MKLPNQERYEERLTLLLKQCTEDFQGRPDAFLWNCRRCLECIIHARQTQENPKHQPGKNEGEVVGFAGKLPRGLQAEWRFLVEKSNLAVHVQGPGAGDPSGDALTCKEHLDKIVRWYFDPESSAADKLPPQVLKSLECLRAGGTRPRDPDSEQQEAQRKLAASEAKIDQLQQQLAELRGQAARAGVLESALQTERTRGAQLTAELANKERELLDARAFQASSRFTPTPPPVTHPTRPATQVRWVPHRTGLVFLLAVAALAVGWKLQAKTPYIDPSRLLDGAPPRSSVQPPPATFPATQALGAMTAESPASSSSSSSWQVIPTPSGTPERTCPDGMLRVAPRSIRLSLPQRNWVPRTARAPDAIDVEPFCIDRDLVSVGEFADCVRNGWCKDSSAEQKGCGKDGPPSHPALCRTQQEAELFCRKMRHGQLPSVVQREAASRLNLHIYNRTGEWSQDPFPSPVFGIGAIQENCKGRGAGRCYMIHAQQVQNIPSNDPSSEALNVGWNRDLGSTRRGDVGFRCVQ